MRTKIIEATQGGLEREPASGTLTGPRAEPEETRFWSHVDKSGECWLWTGHQNGDGYGYFWAGLYREGTQRKVLAHRWSFEQANGRAPVGDVDHTCHNGSACRGGPTCLHRRCVRPDHLRDASRSENLRASGNVGKYERNRK